MDLQSFISIRPDSEFPIQNLPYGIFKPHDGGSRAGVAIGDLILDLSLLEELGHFRDVTSQQIFSADSLNLFMALGRPSWKKTRDILQRLLSAETATLRDNAELRARVFHKQSEVTMQLPARIGDYTDFYSSYHHAHNVGTMLRGP
ncbi:MAG: fumarylacetoacetase, partial [Verrucomicrobia bacterium]